jgi:xanthine dehydrogenase iron-sulfur cluster and FAD-binding subunit A
LEKKVWERYYTPATLDQALSLLAHYQTEARIIAGGTDLLIEIEKKLRTPRVLIDITRIAGLDEIRLEGDVFHIGPLVTHNQVAASSLVVERAYPLARACWEVGAPQIRNRGTLAGNLITASPANDTIAPLWALGASVTLKSTRGERALPFDQFFRGVRKTALEPDEMLIDISFPALNANERGTFIKLGLRKTQAISIVNAAAVLGLEGDLVRTARITFGSVAPTIVRALDAESFLVGKSLSAETIRQAGELAIRAAKPIGDIRSSADYRADMVRVLTRRALSQLANGTERADWPKNPAMLWGKTDGHFPTGVDPQATHTVEGGEPIVTTVNGQPYTVRGANDKTLLHMLREDIGLTGTKEGCAEGECGACTIFLDGIAVMACLVPAPRANGSHIITIEGLTSGTSTPLGLSRGMGLAPEMSQGLAHDRELHPVQQAFIDQDAIQCGYCTPGFIMAGAKLLDEFPQPDRQQVEQSISGNLCRCTGYVNIVRAIEHAATLAGHER